LQTGKVIIELFKEDAHMDEATLQALKDLKQQASS